jgi:dolichol-phosphate mannosyltransferase
MGTREERIVVIIPALNEEQTIGDVLAECHETLNGKNYDILVVDGRSSDETVRISRQKRAQVIFQKGTGYGDALVSGFGHALRVLKPDVVVMMDADGTYAPRNISDLLKPIIDNEADMVIGDRFAGLEEGSMSFISRVGNRFFSGLSKRLFNTGSLDTQSGFRAFRTEMLSNLVFRNPGMAFASEMIVEVKNAKYRVMQVPVTYKLRRGKSKLRPFRDGWYILGVLVRLYRDWSPLLFFGAMGGVLLLGGIILALYLTALYFLVGMVPSFVSTTIVAVMFVSGLVIFVMGLLADMIKDMRERLRVFETQLAENLLNNRNSRNKQATET